MIDVVIVGGGPVGLATAIAARSHGLSVLLAERQCPPIDKACGEGLMPAGVAALAALGVVPPPRSLPFRGIRYFSDGVVAEGDFPGAPGRGIRRTDLHAALARRAQEVGVELHWGTRVESVVPGEVRSLASTWRCRFIVGADGLRSAVRQVAELGGTRSGISGAPAAPGSEATGGGWDPRARFGVARHLRLAPWSEHVEVTFGKAAETYVTPLAADEVGVAILWSGGKGGFDELLAERFPVELGKRFAGAPSIGRDHGAGPLLQPVRGTVVVDSGFALVGDAAGYVDALTGEGLSLGFESALALGEALAAGDLESYARRYKRLAALPNGLTRLLLVAARRPWLRRRLVAALAADRQLFSSFLGLLGARRPLSELPIARTLRLGGRLALPLPAA